LSTATRTSGRSRKGSSNKSCSRSAEADGGGALDSEKNPDILAAAIGNLACYPSPETRPLLLQFLNSNSYRNELADAAISAMRSQDDPAFLPALLAALAKRETDLTSSGFAQGLGTLAYLARNEEKKDAARQFLLGRLNDQERTVQLAAIRALGALGDAQAIAALQTFANAAKGAPGQAAAERAVTDLRAGRKPVDDFKNLRQEFLDLQKTSRDLRKELDDLKARSPKPEAPRRSPARRDWGNPRMWVGCGPRGAGRARRQPRITNSSRRRLHLPESDLRCS
jgi:HEAT repeat protein